jgi:hypothetical protein
MKGVVLFLDHVVLGKPEINKGCFFSNETNQTMWWKLEVGMAWMRGRFAKKFCEGFPPFQESEKIGKTPNGRILQPMCAGLDPVSATQLGVWLPLEDGQGRLREVRELPKTNQGGTPY